MWRSWGVVVCESAGDVPECVLRLPCVLALLERRNSTVRLAGTLLSFVLFCRFVTSLSLPFSAYISVYLSVAVSLSLSVFVSLFFLQIRDID